MSDTNPRISTDTNRRITGSAAQALLAVASGPLFIVSAAGEIIAHNNDADDTLQQAISKALSADSSDPLKLHVARVCDDKSGFESNEWTFCDTDGCRTVAVAMHHLTLSDNDESGSPGCALGFPHFFGEDVVDLKVKDSLLHASRLASIGEMSAGVAHELNQPLNVIRMSSQNLIRSAQKGVLDPHAAVTKLERINQQVERAAKIIGGLQAFGRKRNGDPSRVSATAVIQEALDLFVEQFALTKIELNYQPLSAPAFINVDATAISQVIVNLLQNARDAIDGHCYGVGRIDVVESTSGGVFKVVVSDNGGGIPKDVISHVFDPFFTTKQLGKGTGLGLSISYGIAQEAGGQLEVCNAGEGAQFTLSLPLA